MKKLPSYSRIRKMSGVLKFHLRYFPGSHKLHNRTLALYGDTLESFTVTRINGTLYFFRTGGKQERNVWVMTPQGAINPIHNDDPIFTSIYSSHHESLSHERQLLSGQEVPELISPK